MAGLHRTVSTIRKAVSTFLENPTPARASVVRSMRALGHPWERAIGAFSVEERARLDALLGDVAEAA